MRDGTIWMICAIWMISMLYSSRKDTMRFAEGIPGYVTSIRRVLTDEVLILQNNRNNGGLTKVSFWSLTLDFGFSGP